MNIYGKRWNKIKKETRLNKEVLRREHLLDKVNNLDVYKEEVLIGAYRSILTVNPLTWFRTLKGFIFMFLLLAILVVGTNTFYNLGWL